MANWENLKASIEAVIKQNGNEEITGQVLQNTLKTIVNSVGENATFAGIATPETNPGTPDGPVFYLAAKGGTYVNFNGINIDYNTASFLLYTDSVWSKLDINITLNSQINAIIVIPTETIEYTLKQNQFWDGSKYVAHDDFDSTSKIVVNKNQIIQVVGVGGANARLSYYYNNNDKLLMSADPLSDSALMPIYEDGYIICNTKNTQTIKIFKLSENSIIWQQFSSIIKNSSKIAEIYTELFDSNDYDNTFLQVGYFYDFRNLNVGDFAPAEPSLFGEGSTEWGCLKISVSKGMSITVATIGGANGKAYALTDKNRKILTIADANVSTIDSPITLSVSESGYLYVNQKGTENTKFNVRSYISIKFKVDDLSNRVSILEEKVSSMDVHAPCMYNPLPNFQKEEFRILDIGNSYTVDSTHYLPQIAQAEGIDLSKICLYTAVRGGASFKTWFDTYHDNDTKTYSINKILGGLNANTDGVADIGNGEKFRNTLINNSWDVIIIHQVSTYAPYYDTWQGDSDAGYLNQFIRLLRKHQPKASIGFLLVHSYWSGYSGNVEKSSLKRWELIAQSAKKIRANFGLDFIIPYGTAIQNLRKSSLNNEYDLTADGTHCANGIADYTAACAYYQAAFVPRYGGSILGNTARITVEPTEQYPSSDISVTDTTAPVAQKAAFLANYNWYECINPDTINDEDLI